MRDISNNNELIGGATILFSGDFDKLYQTFRATRVNEKGFPKESFVVKLLEDSVSNQQERLSAIRGVHFCYKKLASDAIFAKVIIRVETMLWMCRVAHHLKLSVLVVESIVALHVTMCVSLLVSELSVMSATWLGVCQIDLIGSIRDKERDSDIETRSGTGIFRIPYLKTRTGIKNVSGLDPQKLYSRYHSNKIGPTPTWGSPDCECSTLDNAATEAGDLSTRLLVPDLSSVKRAPLPLIYEE
uniref:Uncharacterized protein n=1 Tax=Timema monikensis TaxID=170555 RepID=A0A7R9E9E4_9NEOP|nr:unnamed protein product [Timema monikensis]